MSLSNRLLAALSKKALVSAINPSRDPFLETWVRPFAAMSATMQRLVLAMLAAPCAAMRLAPMAPRLATRAGVVSMAENRFTEKILDNSLPDPVYDEMGGDGGYLGKSNIGFSQGAETWNGRAAMVGFTICFLQEIVMGKGVLEAYGIGYDEGAVPQPVMR